MHARIIGAGLIGTSLGLALTAQRWTVEMVDLNPTHQLLSQDLVGAVDPSLAPDLVIFALPSSRLSSVIVHEFELNPQATFMDVGSVKTKPQLEVNNVQGLSVRFCGTHPMAGRESGGPEAARADLFVGRPWIVTPDPKTDPEVLAEVLDLISELGAIGISMTPADHDRAMALISHLPQVAASLLAGQLEGADPDWLALSGQGLRDSTRIARSDPKLWREILSMNREEIRPLLRGLNHDLTLLVEEFDSDDRIEAFLEGGNSGVRGIPGKHGGVSRDYFHLPIVIEDKPGQLGALFHECAVAGVNVEDLSIEHSPGQFTGLITLALSKSDAEILSAHLEKEGWKVHSLR